MCIRDRHPPAPSRPLCRAHLSAGRGPLDGSGTSGRVRLALRAAAALLGVVAVIYLVGVAVFSRRYVPGTTVNGDDVSLKTPAEVAEDYERAAGGYELSVSGQGVSCSISAEDVGLSYRYADTLAESSLSSTAWSWPVLVTTGNALSVDFSPGYDEGRLASVVQGVVDDANRDATQPTNATVSYDEDGSSFEIVPERTGTALDGAIVLDKVKEALSTSARTLELGPDSLMAPSVLSTDPALAGARDRANAMLAATQTLTVNGTTVATVSAAQIADWVRLDDDLTPVVDEGAVTDWARGDFSAATDTVGATRRYTTPYGKSVTVAGGTYGWVVNGAALAQAIAANITAGSAATVEIPFSSSAGRYNPGGADWPRRYVDVDLSEQHARMYDDDGNLAWESDIVTGDSTKGFNTATGVYAMNSYRGTNQTLRGLDLDGDNKPDYISHVTYWMPFVGNLVAFHDAGWRGSFGGTIYRSRGSHGCINLPFAAAQRLYELTRVGDVVVVHD
ncbi:L,D-transpeptidase family protein [Olsenella massiliensis]|uniref:L,D-transpeptidase family protein n=1 Tax=Olsenella massiliensis TaxID=1622075 RepID=UPI00071CCC45|nr:L,D-transpeptidase family protein [Olsenella massiliensis]